MMSAKMVECGYLRVDQSGNKLYLPDVTEDGGVWKSKSRNRVVK